MRKLIFLMFGLLIFFSCSDNSERIISTVKKDSLKINPAHPPDSVPPKRGKLASGEVDTTFRSFAFIAEDKYIIISAFADTNWVSGKPHSPASSNGGVYSALTDVNLDSLPSTYADLINKKFRVWSSAGDTYLVKITGLKLYSAFIPHFGQVQMWNGTNGEEGLPFTKEQQAGDIWNSAALYLVAEFDPGNAVLSDLFFAVPEDKPEPVLFSQDSKEITEAAYNKISLLLNKDEDYSGIQQEYTEKSERKDAQWWKDTESNEGFTVFNLSNKESYATLNHSCGNPCGGDFYFERFSIWRLLKNSPAQLLYMTESSFGTILSLDLDGDKTPEFLIDDGFGNRFLLKKENKEWTRIYSWNIPYQDCPC